MARRRTQVAQQRVPHVELLNPEDIPSAPLATREMAGPSGVVTVGKIPGELKDIPVRGTGVVTIRALFIEIGLIAQLERCEVQRNGEKADLDETVEPGDTVLAIAKIRGNTN